MNRVLLDKLIVAQLLKYSTNFVEPEVCYHVHKNLPPEPYLSQFNPVQEF